MPEYISRAEMLAALTSRPNVKISHRLFAPDEYLYLGVDGNVYDENDYLFDDFETPAICGLRMRTGDTWEHGWYIKETNNALS